jgi:dsDNA-specific endonuclease/ATPase MutS2
MLTKEQREEEDKLADLYNKLYISQRNIGRVSLDEVDKALEEAFEEAIDNRIKEIEIIPGKGSGQLRKKVERFLQMPQIKPKYHRIENDSKNFGRLFVYFRFDK